MTEEFILEETVGMQKKRAAVMVGRMNPPTRGHYKVIDTMKAYMRNNPDLNLAAPVVVVVEGEKTSQDKSKNPLSAEDRIKFMQASGQANGVQFLTAPSGFAAFEAVRRAGYEPISVAAGSDRADNYIKILNKYFTTPDGGKIAHTKIDLPRENQEGPSDDKKGAMEKALAALKNGDVLDDSEVSGTMARRAVELGYLKEFAHITGLQDKPKLAQLMFNKIKAVLPQEEEKTDAD